jgi:hypothetical protein
MRRADRENSVFVSTRIPGNEAFKLWPRQWGGREGGRGDLTLPSVSKNFNTDMREVKRLTFIKRY